HRCRASRLGRESVTSAHGAPCCRLHPTCRRACDTLCGSRACSGHHCMVVVAGIWRRTSLCHSTAGSRRLHRVRLRPNSTRCLTLMRPSVGTRKMSPESGCFAFLPPCRSCGSHPLATCSDFGFSWLVWQSWLVCNRHNGHQATATIGWNTLLASMDEAGFRHAGEGAEIRECEGESMPQNIYDDPEFFAGYSQLR